MIAEEFRIENGRVGSNDRDVLVHSRREHCRINLTHAGDRISRDVEQHIVRADFDIPQSISLDFIEKG